MTQDGERLSFIGRRLPPAFELRTVTIPAGGSLPYDAADWRDALAILESGALEVECPHGARRAFAPGALMPLGGLDLRALHAVGPEPVVLTAVSRRQRPQSNIGGGAADDPSG